MSPVETVLHFLSCINHRHADKLAELMTEDHVFIDSLGHAVQGREKMRAGWKDYFTLCPITGFLMRRFFKVGTLLPYSARRAVPLPRAANFPCKINGERPQLGWRWWKKAW